MVVVALPGLGRAGAGATDRLANHRLAAGSTQYGRSPYELKRLTLAAAGPASTATPFAIS